MKKIIYIFLFLLVGYWLNAQSIIARSYVKDKQVFLRFIAKDYVIWEEIKTKGFKIERTELNNISDTAILVSLPTTVLNATPIKPLAKEDAQWANLIETTDYGPFIYNGLYAMEGTKEGDLIVKQTIWGMLMKQADLNAESAKLLGLYFKDANININKFYVYKISVVEKGGDAKHSVRLLVDPKKETFLPSINLKLSEVKIKRISLTFPAKLNERYFSGFIIERSKDSLSGYKSVTPKPIIFIVGEHEVNKTDITHQDTLPDTKTNYYYRIKGVSYFGELGPAGKIMRVKGKDPIGSYPYMDSVKLFKKETQLKVYFHFPKGVDLAAVKGISITRSDNSGGLGDRLTAKLLPANATSFLDEKPHQTNYYKVLAISLDNDTIPSFEGFGMLPDRDPPAVPAEIKGFIDSTGLVHINWKANSEKDIQGYRIFRKNAMDEELIERTRRIVTTNGYVDTVDIKTLTKYIYYSLTAVDKVYNNSTYSTVIKLKRPDIIAPVPPPFVKTMHTNKSILLKWYNSTSDDVEKYELYRINSQTQQIEKIKEWAVSDTVSNYSDSTATLGENYRYKIIVFDDSKNKSESFSPYITFETGLRKPITDITQKTDLEKRSIELSWSYPEKDIYNFIIYKAKEKEPFRIYKTLRPAEFKLTDKQLDPGNVYKYCIKATYISGVESELSKEIKITF